MGCEYNENIIYICQYSIILYMKANASQYYSVAGIILDNVNGI